MSTPVIHVEDVSKLYRLGEVGTGTLQHDINRWWHRIRGKEDPYSKIGHINDRTRKSTPAAAFSEYVWALKDINFSVNQGEVLGIIGRNGAGKSTLLKLLSRVTSPTSGSIKVKGRIASLLEVGTGFHPELSGRENIFLNGAILGMRRHEITRKLDEIVEFSGCAAYLDTPVKRYSSGMTVRLAFAVAAHLDAEVIIVDEVLAVGDADFQQKCLGKMKNICDTSGRTVIFVSHNMAAVEMLCHRAVYLEQGKLMCLETDIRSVITRYLSLDQVTDERVEWVNKDQQKLNSSYFTPLRIRLSNQAGTKAGASFSGDEDIWLHVEGVIESYDPGLTLGYALYDANGHSLYWSFTIDVPEEERVSLVPGKVQVATKIPKQFLNEGSYRLDFAASLHNRTWLIEPAVTSPGLAFKVQGRVSDSPQYTKPRNTILAPIFAWSNYQQPLSNDITN